MQGKLFILANITLNDLSDGIDVYEGNVVLDNKDPAKTSDIVTDIVRERVLEMFGEYKEGWGSSLSYNENLVETFIERITKADSVMQIDEALQELNEIIESNCLFDISYKEVWMA